MLIEIIMGNLFKRNRPKKEPPSRIQQDDRTIAELKITRDKIKNYQKKLESQISALKQGIKNCILSKRKDQALLALRKQKFLEKTLSSTHGELLNIDSIINNIESAQMTAKAVQALQQGNELLKKMNKELTVEDVDKLMAETDEAIEYQHQVGLALSQQGVVENDDLMEELDKLEVEQYELPSVPEKRLKKEQIDLPNVPDRPIAKSEKARKQAKVVLEEN